jgi:amino acid transporter
MSQQFVSSTTVIALVIGAIIAYFYLYFGWKALRKSIQTRNEPDEGPGDKYRHSVIGAILSVAVSIVSIAIYGAGPIFLYWGPILAMVAAVAVTYALRDEVIGQHDD